MKDATIGHDDKSISRAIASLCSALLSMQSEKEMRALLEDLLTPSELEAMADRWRVVPFLQNGLSYRDIHEKTGVSVTTIGRVARYLKSGNGGYQIAWERLNESDS